MRRWASSERAKLSSTGTVFLFGKVYVENAKTFVSCCVTVKNIERRIFILPRVKVRVVIFWLMNVLNFITYLLSKEKKKSFEWLKAAFLNRCLNKCTGSITSNWPWALPPPYMSKSTHFSYCMLIMILSKRKKKLNRNMVVYILV